MRNILKEKLARGEKPLGTFVGTGSAAVVECLGCAGLDFVILDNEHSPIEAETTARLVCAAERRNITPLARFATGDLVNFVDENDAGVLHPLQRLFLHLLHVEQRFHRFGRENFAGLFHRHACFTSMLRHERLKQ